MDSTSRCSTEFQELRGNGMVRGYSSADTSTSTPSASVCSSLLLEYPNNVSDRSTPALWAPCPLASLGSLVSMVPLGSSRASATVNANESTFAMSEVRNALHLLSTITHRLIRMNFWNQIQLARFTSFIARGWPCVHSRHVRSRGETTQSSRQGHVNAEAHSGGGGTNAPRGQ
jgi:hypothetical protein